MNEGRIAMAASCLALVLAVGSAAGVGYLFQHRDHPPAPAIEKYDFSTPAQALKSQLRMEQSCDFNAISEYRRRIEKDDMEERISTLEVKKEAEWHGNIILFITCKRKGETKYATCAYTKDAKSGYWLGSDVGPHGVEKDNKQLAATMRRWEEAGSFDPAPVASK